MRALVRSADVTAKEYGAYVVPVSGDVTKAPAVTQALLGTRAIVVTGPLGPHLLSAAQAAGVEHIVVPSLAGAHDMCVVCVVWGEERGGGAGCHLFYHLLDCQPSDKEGSLRGDTGSWHR